MYRDPLPEDQKIDRDHLTIEEMDIALTCFDPACAVAGWTPTAGGENIASLNKLADEMIEKAAEIKLYLRTLTAEELNELDGFDRCGEYPPVVHDAITRAQYELSRKM
jgi:hypothetical protein